MERTGLPQRQKHKHIDWSVPQFCSQCNSQMRKYSDKSSKLVAHLSSGICRNCFNRNKVDTRGRKNFTIKFDDSGQWCRGCEIYKTFDNFVSNNECLSGFNSTCKACKVLWVHNLTYDRYTEMLEQQGYKCAICYRPEEEFNKRWHIDHDHTCCPNNGKKMCGTCIRGLLCYKCNLGIGHFEDQLDRLESAINYLKGKK